MLKWILGTLLGIILGMAAYFSWYLGAFKPVTLLEEDSGPYYFLYREHVGPYHKVAPVIQEMEIWAKGHGIKCDLTFGQYFDDPRVVEEGRLKSHVGCLISETEFANLQNAQEGIQKKTIPPAHYLIATFEGSPAIGPMKVYPKAEEYFRTKQKVIQDAVIEIYEIHSEKSMTTKYLFIM